MSEEGLTKKRSIDDSGEPELTEEESALLVLLSKGKKKYVRFVLAALGSIPWVGGVIAAGAAFDAERDQGKVNELQRLWLAEHQEKIVRLREALGDILLRLDGLGEEIQGRIESPQYLTLVRRTFRAWDQADTEEKRQMFKRLLSNAGASTLCPDDLIRLFISWIEMYHEAHFAVIREIYKQPGITRGEIWDNLNPERPREDSAEADLYRYLIRELSTGGVIRQARARTASGEFLRKRRTGKRAGTPSLTMESAFEDEKSYELTELGSQFVHYVLEDVIRRVKAGESII